MGPSTNRTIRLTVNEEEVSFTVEDRETLLELLRERLGLTGTKEGCGTGECGTCTVLVEGRPVLACLTLAVEADGKRVTTIEGLGRDGRLTALQRAFIDCGAVQCGYCTPGMIMTAAALLAEVSRPTRGQIQKALEGNLCRCTGYNKIVEAVEKAGAEE